MNLNCYRYRVLPIIEIGKTQNKLNEKNNIYNSKKKTEKDCQFKDILNSYMKH